MIPNADDFGRIESRSKIDFLKNVLRNIIFGCRNFFVGRKFARTERKVVDIGVYRSRQQLRSSRFFQRWEETSLVYTRTKNAGRRRKKMDRTRSGCHALEEFENDALLPGIQFTPSTRNDTRTPSESRFRPVHHVVVLITALNDVRSEEWHGFSGFRVVKSSGTRSGTAVKICFSATRVYLYVVRVSPPAAPAPAPAETDRFSLSFERRRGMKPLSQPTTLVDVFFPCTRGCVPDSLFSLSLHLFISLPLCLFFSPSFFPPFCSCERMGAKEGGRDTGVQSPGQISSTARTFASVSGDERFAKILCSRRFVATTASSRVERRSRARESKGKKRRGPAHSTSEEEEGGVCVLELCRGLP